MIYTHAAVALLAAVLAFGGAWRVQEWRWHAKVAEGIEAQRENERIARRAADGAAAAHEGDREKIRTEFQTVFQEVERVVEKPVYRDVCIDADGLRIIAGAIAGNRSAAGEPARAVPGPDGAR